MLLMYLLHKGFEMRQHCNGDFPLLRAVAGEANKHFLNFFHRNCCSCLCIALKGFILPYAPGAV